MGPALAALLPKLHLASTLARDLVHGPTRYAAPDITNLYTYAGTSRIKMFLGHMRKEDETSKLLKIALGCCQQELGIGDNILQENFEKHGWLLQHCWIKELWRFVHSINGSIEINDDWIQERCENDIFLMRQVFAIQLTES